jgi:hypothetical protein
MKSARVVAIACTFFLVSAVGFAQTPTKAPLTREAIDAILGLSPVGGGCAKTSVSPNRVVFAAKKTGPDGGIGEMAYCVAACESGSVNCTGTTSCEAYDRNCTTGERGHVSCNNGGTVTTTWCPTACPNDFCYNCAQTGGCVDCCRCDGGGPVICNNCCTCDATGDCFACCRCGGGSLSECNSACYPF